MGRCITVNVQEVLTRCRDLGITLAPGPEGKLRASPPGRLPEDLREALRRHKAEVLAALRSTPLTLRCRHCRHDARPEGGTLSKDGTNYIQWWNCLNPQCAMRGSTVFRLQ